MLTLYTHPISQPARTVWWLMAWKLPASAFKIVVLNPGQLLSPPSFSFALKKSWPHNVLPHLNLLALLFFSFLLSGSPKANGSRSPSFLAKTDNVGTVPALELPSGQVIYEMNAIMAYLADKRYHAKNFSTVDVVLQQTQYVRIQYIYIIYA